MRWVKSETAAFRKTLAETGMRGYKDSAKVAGVVAEVLARVRKDGDGALAEYTLRFDGFDPRKKGFAVSRKEIDAAWKRVPGSFLASLSLAAERIESFHRHQRQSGFTAEIPGAVVGQRVTPVSRAGVYVPGGKAAYPSTLLMNAIPARLAGVREVYAACAAPGGRVPDVVLAAARIARVSEVYRIGGAQAIAAFAFGTESIPKVDVVAGPGNAYVTEAKRQVYGVVGIDMLAGPSELVVLADDSAKAAYVAADLLSQAEHDEDAFVALVTDSEYLSGKVEAELKKQAKRLPRREILAASLSRSLGFLVRSLSDGVDAVNAIAPEHLSIMVENPWAALEGIRNAGTAFLGPFSPVAVGDYIAGINHILPTGGAARFSSPLGVANFLKRTNVVSYKVRALASDAPHVVRLAGKEGLAAHAQAVLARRTEGEA
ncbi:MAG: histidinol dehydrogenase [Deltaproteobacteria bacterium]|nr:histidinol dehydrogenase [Deltaproteobacteria bacterium]